MTLESEKELLQIIIHAVGQHRDLTSDEQQYFDKLFDETLKEEKVSENT